MLGALRYFLPQWRQSKRSWWRRCWLPGWTRPPPTNIFNSFAVQEPPEKEVSQSWSFFNFSFSPQSTKCYQLYPCFKQYTRPPITKAFLFTNMCQRKGDKPQPYICVFDPLASSPSIILQLWATVLVFPSPTLLKRIATETLCNAGGAVSFRTAEESVENAKEVLNAFDRAIQKHKNRPKIEVPKRKFFPCFSIPAVSSLHVFYKRCESQRACVK